VEDPSTAFLFREEWRRISRRQGKKAARRVALRLRLWPDRRYKGRGRGCPPGTGAMTSISRRYRRLEAAQFSEPLALRG